MIEETDVILQTPGARGLLSLPRSPCAGRKPWRAASQGALRPLRPFRLLQKKMERCTCQRLLSLLVVFLWMVCRCAHPRRPGNWPSDTRGWQRSGWPTRSPIGTRRPSGCGPRTLSTKGPRSQTTAPTGRAELKINKDARLRPRCLLETKPDAALYSSGHPEQNTTHKLCCLLDHAMALLLLFCLDRHLLHLAGNAGSARLKYLFFCNR